MTEHRSFKKEIRSLASEKGLSYTSALALWKANSALVGAINAAKENWQTKISELAQDEIPVGINDNGDLVKYSVVQNPHSLIMGVTGGGKTELSRFMIEAVHSRAEWTVIAYDGLKTLPASLTEAVESLSSPTPTLIIIDEVSLFLAAEQLREEIEMITRLGRSYQTYLICFSQQKPDSQTLVNACLTRIQMGNLPAYESKFLLNTEKEQPQLFRGSGVMRTATEKSLQSFRIPLTN